MREAKAVSHGDDFVQSASPGDETASDHDAAPAEAASHAALFGAARNVGYGVLGFGIVFAVWYATWLCMVPPYSGCGWQTSATLVISTCSGVLSSPSRRPAGPSTSKFSMRAVTWRRR